MYRNCELVNKGEYHLIKDPINTSHAKSGLVNISTSGSPKYKQCVLCVLCAQAGAARCGGRRTRGSARLTRVGVSAQCSRYDYHDWAYDSIIPMYLL